MIKLLTGKEPAKMVLDNIQKRVALMKERFNNVPRLDVIRVGDDPASERYVRNKQKDADSIGIQCVVHKIDSVVPFRLTIDDVMMICDLVDRLNEDPDVDGIIVQLPFATPQQEYYIINHIAPAKDVDGLTAMNIGTRSIDPIEGFWPCTPEGIMELLNFYEIPIAGKKVSVIGRSNLVGKPLAQMLVNQDATVTLYHSKSSRSRMKFEIPESDTICLCTGVGHGFDVASLIDPETHPEKETTVIDVGISFDDSGHMIGDFDPTGIRPNYNINYTPVPGGIGLMTRAILMRHVIEAAERRSVYDECI